MTRRALAEALLNTSLYPKKWYGNLMEKQKSNARTWLITIRKRKKMTQEEVASAAFIDRAYYAQIESGGRNPSEEIREQLASILDFHPSTFILADESPFRFAMEQAPMVIAYCDLDLRYTWLFNPHADFTSEESIGMRDDELSDNSGTRALMALKQKVIDTGQNFREEITFPLSDGEMTYIVFAHPLLDNEGKIIGAATASTGISSSADTET
jgi:transcriptional regulator with XRE-family HTH domain